MTCWYHCRVDLRRAAGNLVLKKLNKCTGVLQNDRYHGNFLQITATYHIVSNALFLSNYLNKSSPRSGISKVLVWTPGWKKGRKKILVWPCTMLFSAQSSVALWSAGRKCISLEPFQSLDKFIYLLPYSPEYTKLSDTHQWHQSLGTSHTIQKSDI